jgi:branched-chain amino acid aminotransferase
MRRHMMKIYIDGTWYSRDEARISVFDHGLLYGDGVFEGIRIYNNSVFMLEEHVDRLFMSAHAIDLEIPLSRLEIIDLAEKSRELNSLENGYIRLIVTRGVGNLGLNPRSCERATLILIADTISLYPTEYYEEGISLVTASTRRIPAQCLDPRIKSLNYLNNILARQEALRQGCKEAVMLNTEGTVAECTADTLFIVADGVLKTPSLNSGVLDGITRSCVLHLADANGYQVQEEELTMYDLYTADECFLCGTACEIMPVHTIDNRKIGPGKPGLVTKTFKSLYLTLIHGPADANSSARAK